MLRAARQRAQALAVGRLNLRRWSSDKSGAQAPVAEEVADGAAASAAPTERAELDAMREAVRSLSFLNPEASGVSEDLRAKLTKEFDDFLEEFVQSVDPSVRAAESMAEKVSGVDAGAFGRAAHAASNLKTGFASVVSTEPDQPYSEAEMYVRQLFHAKRVAGLGAEIRDIYRPHEDLHRPKSIRETGLSNLIAAGAHLGHSTSRVRANSLSYVYGVRDGIHIIDLQQTLAGLRRVARVAEDLAKRGGLILFIGTRDGQHRTVEKAAERAHGYYVHDRWVPGTLTNYQIVSDQKRKVSRSEVTMADEPTRRQISPSLHDTIIKPDLVVLLNPVENRALLAECIKMRIPTTGIVDTDSEPSLLTYPVPGNDDSLRFADLYAGIISRAAARGRALRVAAFKEHKATKQRLRDGEIMLSSSLPPEKNLGGVSDAEKRILESQ